MTSVPYEYWASGRGLDNITPQGKAWPEGHKFPEFMTLLVGDRSVLEFGCGVGRLACLFDAGRYVGVDVCEAALRRARVVSPAHLFALVGREGALPSADLTLAHTVLLHIPDDELPGVVSRFESPAVLVSEILGRHWRREGDPPVFNRECEDYVDVFADRYELRSVCGVPYPHYRATELTVMEFVRR